ncbi:MAG: SDR family NAD(P)-dependent oxidoreductase [Deltaproteobacteria bacterium]|nr:SDR family NAD(P)-dependent oxidoreductase [Deltaproteobacteria bacterium]
MDKDIKSKNSFKQSPLAIIGIGCLFPKADDLDAYWANITNRVDAITGVPKTHWRTEDYCAKDSPAPESISASRGGFISPVQFNPMEFGIPPNAIEAIDTSQLLALVVTQQALKDAGYGPDRDFDRDRVSVILGVTGTLELVLPLGARLGHPIWRKCLKESGVEDSVAEDAVKRISDSYVSWQENSFPGLLGNVVAGRVAKTFNLGGTNCVIDAACASSMGALHLAGMELSSGRSDMVITGGVDTFNDIFMYTCFSQTQALSPTGDARPFDITADGTILGEGLGIMLLKRLEDARRDQDRIYAVIRGMGTSSDGKGQAIYAPSIAGQTAALTQAYESTGISADTIELVEAHGTGTRAGDATELSALIQVYGSANKDRTWCALGSVKSQMGHTKAAAGVAGIIKTAMALHHKVLPPTIKVTQPPKEISNGRSPFYVNTEKRPWMPKKDHPRRAVVSAFGFGGSNFHCVLEESRSEKSEIVWDGHVQILPFSAKSADELKSAIEAWPADLSWDVFREKAERSRAKFNKKHDFRLVMVVEKDRTDISGAIGNALAMLNQYHQKKSWNTPDGAYFGAGSVPGKLGLIFPGQGSQYVGMLRDLACRFPQMQQVLVEADQSFTDGILKLRNKEIQDRQDSGDCKPLTDYIYPHPVFNEEAEENNESALRATQVAQPAIGAVSLGALKVLNHFEVRPEAVAGHSYGELTALCVSGRISTKALHSLSVLRGLLMSRGNGDKGAMLAAQAPLSSVERIISEEKLNIIVANKNAPNQAVLSGFTEEIKRAAQALAKREIRNIRLPVSAAFHSSLVGHLEKPFLSILRDIEFSGNGIPVFANSTAKEYPEDPEEARRVLAAQLVNPVEFIEEIENMYRSGVRTFLEVGPGARLTGLVNAILEKREHNALSLDKSSGKRSGVFDLACALASLSAQGHHTNLSLWSPLPDNREVPAQRKKGQMTVPICGANYRKPKPSRPPLSPPKVSVPPGSSGTVPVSVTSHQPIGKMPASPHAGFDSLTEALRTTQENLAYLQKIQEQTAQLHQQFLEGQDTAQRTIQGLMEQQRKLLQASLGMTKETSELVIPEHAPRIDTAPIQPQNQPVTPADEQFLTSEPSVPDPGSGAVERILLKVVSDKTGYPVDMLEMDMELDSDLGIDSIKRVEILSVLHEKLPEAPAVKPEHLGSLKTLGQIVEFLSEGKNIEEQPKNISPEKADSKTKPRSMTAQAHSNIGTILLEVVSDKTGYPSEMLEMDMELDSDLGIDSIKRVEILSVLQEKLPEAPAVKPEHLGSLKTLHQIVEFLSGTSGAFPEEKLPVSKGLSSAGETETGEVFPEQISEEPALRENTIERFVLSLIRLDENETRQKLSVSQGSRIWITEEDSGLALLIKDKLHSLNYRPELISFKDLRDMERPSNLGGLIILSPAKNAGDTFLKDSFKLLRLAGSGLRKAGMNGGSVLLTVSRLDGAFGLTSLNGGNDPASGGLAGLLKTARHEWSEVHCKALDLSGDFENPAQASAAIVDEMFLKGPLEVGLSNKGRYNLQLLPAPLEEALLLPSTKIPLSTGDAVVITGGARGITAEIATELSRAFKPTLVLLGRSNEPGPEPDWLATLSTEAEIKKALVERAGERPSLKEIAKQHRSIIANRELLRNIARIEAAGAKVIYRSVDIRDTENVRSVIKEVRDHVGPVKGLIHGAGVLADRLIEEKTDEQFDLVYSTKVTGLRALLDVLELEDLKVMVLFSSFTGRHGRSGQADYAAANEVLNKFAQQQSRLLPNCRVVSVNWGPWNGGMVTSSLRKVFEKEGVALIDLKAGANYLVREISANSDRPVEVVIMGRNLDEHNKEASLSARDTRAEVIPETSPLSMAFERQLDIENYPFLQSHVLNGRPVLPMAVMIEWMAHGALHGNPGLRFIGFDNLRMLKGVILDEEKPCTIRVMAGRTVKKDGFRMSPVKLISAGGNGREYIHASAEIVLGSTLPKGDASITGVSLAPYNRNETEIYNTDLLFHGPHFQGIRQVEGCSRKGIVASVSTAPIPAEWIKNPLRNTWLADPLVLDSAFQMMILWSFENNGVGALPCFAGRFRRFQPVFPKQGVRIVISVTRDSEHRALADIEFIDPVTGKLIARMEDYECVMDASLNCAFKCNRLPLQNEIKASA